MRCTECKGKRPLRAAQLPRGEQVPYPGHDQAGKHLPWNSPSVFIGSFGYPDVQGGPHLVNDSAPDWLARNLIMEEIVGIRAARSAGDQSCF